MSAYMVLQIEWTNKEAREAYVQDLSGMVERRGGRFLVASSESKVVEGQGKPRRWVLIEFPTMKALTDWYESEEYRPLLELRLKSSHSDAVMIEGVPAGPPSA
ncbi:MAG: DUF1330 domain-containing protein [Thermoplasmata archaeon]